MEKKQKDSVLKKFLRIPVNIFNDVRDVKNICECISKAGKIAKKTKCENSKESIKKAREDEIKYFESLTTSKERITFFYRYFKRKNIKDPLECAYAATYLVENTDLFKGKDPFEVASCFETDRYHALSPLISKYSSNPNGFKSNRPYTALIDSGNEKTFTDEYKMQCLNIAICKYFSEIGNKKMWPYVFDMINTDK